MKIKTTLISFLFTSTTLAFLSGCTGGKKEAESHQHEAATSEASEAAAPQFTVDENFQKQLSTVFTSYVSLKDAFVASDVEKVKSEASNTSQAVAKVDMKLLSGAAHNDWMAYLGSIDQSLKEIQGSSDLAVQRKAFSNLSDGMYKSIKAFGLSEGEAFYEFCPMAFNNEGAYWLSDKEVIRNPYFGDEMLTCGSVQEKLK